MLVPIFGFNTLGFVKDIIIAIESI
jgi:hypothetical protein